MLGLKLERERMYLKSSLHQKEVGLACRNSPVLTVYNFYKIYYYIRGMSCGQIEVQSVCLSMLHVHFTLLLHTSLILLKTFVA